MSYIGNPPAEAYTNTVKDTFSGDGSTVAFTLSLPTTTNNVRVVVENVIQDPTVAYGVSGTTLTFTSAPPSGTNNIYVVHLGPAVQTVQPPTDLSGNFTLTGDLTQTGDYTLTGAASISGQLDTASILPTADATSVLGGASNRYTNLYLSGGVYLGGTGAANYLDDYESGSWTPSYIPGSNSFSSITYDASVTGRYVKVGDIVHAAGFVSTDALSIGSATGGLSIDGLPFTVENSPSDVHLWAGSIAFVDNFAGDTPISTIARRNTTNLGLYYRTSVNGGSITLDVSDMSTASNSNVVYFSVTYRTTA